MKRFEPSLVVHELLNFRST